MANRLIKLPEVKELVGLSTSSIYRLVESGDFPKQVNLGPRSVAWVQEEIFQWMESKIDNRQLQEETSKEKEGRPKALELAKRLTGEELIGKSDILESSRSTDDLSGIYFLINENEIVYIGQSVNVYSRIAEHRRNREFDSFTFVACAREDLDVLESLYIHAYLPSQNGRLTGKRSGVPHTPLQLEQLQKMASVSSV